MYHERLVVSWGVRGTQSVRITISESGLSSGPLGSSAACSACEGAWPAGSHHHYPASRFPASIRQQLTTRGSSDRLDATPQIMERRAGRQRPPMTANHSSLDSSTAQTSGSTAEAPSLLEVPSSIECSERPSAARTDMRQSTSSDIRELCSTVWCQATESSATTLQ